MNDELMQRAVDAYLSTTGESTVQRLRFFEGIWKIQSAATPETNDYQVPDAEAARDALATGQPLFLVSEPSVPFQEYVDLVVEIAAYVRDAAGLPADQATALADADFAGVLTAPRVAIVVHDPDLFISRIGDELGAGQEGRVSPPTVAFVLMSALVPFVTSAARSVVDASTEMDWRVWDSGNCPVCGSAAALGVMDESTALQGAGRKLWCGLCHTEWSYERLRCARCGTKDASKLHYTYDENDPAHRIHLCDECHGYLKTVFKGELDKPLVPLVEDVVGTELDLIAAEQGYTPLGSHVR